MALCSNFSMCGMLAVSRGRCRDCLSLRAPKDEDDCPLCRARGPIIFFPCDHKSCYKCSSAQRGLVNPFLFPGINPPYKFPLVVARCKKCQRQSCKCSVPDFQTPVEAHKEFFSRDTAKSVCLQCNPRGELPSHGEYLVLREGPDDVWRAEAGEAHEIVKGGVDGTTVVKV